MTAVSVIIPAFNARPWIREAVQSAIDQNIGQAEIIVVDDGSTDGTADIVEKEFQSVRLMRTENQGPSRARNLGTKLSTGEFIQYLDADDMLADGKLKVQLEAIKNSGADVAYGDWQKLIKDKNGKFEKAEEVRRKLNNPEVDLFTDFWCPPAVYLFRRSIVEKIGGWNETLPIIQDARFVLDCALWGAGFVYSGKIMAYYRVQFSGSVSTRNSPAFVRDCFKNAAQIEDWWKGHGGISQERKRALLKVYGYAARASFEKDKEVFEEAHKALERLSPGYVPNGPQTLKMISRLFGYKNAEKIAFLYRKMMGPR